MGVDSSLRAVSASATPYVFPVEVVANIAKFRGLPTPEVLDWFHSGGERYAGPFRKHHCLLNLVLADRGIAPAFRGIPNGVTRATGLSPEQQAESNDRQVHDLHWLYETHRDELNPTHPLMRELLRQGAFDFDLASEVVRTLSRTADKLRHLGATPSMQVELFTLKSREVATLWKTYKEKSRRLEIAVRERARQPRGKIEVANIPLIMGQLMALELAGGSPTGAAVFFSHTTGDAATEQLAWRLSKRRDWFRKEFGVVFEDKLSKLATAGLSHEECQRDVEQRENWFATKKALKLAR